MVDKFQVRAITSSMKHVVFQIQVCTAAILINKMIKKTNLKGNIYTLDLKTQSSTFE